MLLLQALIPDVGRGGGGIPKGQVMVVVLVLLYFLPSMLALKGGKRRKWKILALNTCLGWTILGWIAAMLMVWAYEGPDATDAASP